MSKYDNSWVYDYEAGGFQIQEWALSPVDVPGKPIDWDELERFDFEALERAVIDGDKLTMSKAPRQAMHILMELRGYSWAISRFGNDADTIINLFRGRY